MKDSEEKEHRISNLKDMMKNVSNSKPDKNSSEGQEEIEEAVNDEYEVVEADEMIDLLSEDYDKYPKEEMDVDDEFIFKPRENSKKEESTPNEIDDEFIIETKLEDSEFPEEPQDDLGYEEPKAEYYDEDDFLVEKFDGIINKDIRGYSLLAWASLVIGVVLLAMSVFLFNFSSPRLVDNVISGETNTSAAVSLLVGLFFIVIGIYKMKVVKTPFESILNSIKSVENHEGRKNETISEDEIEQKPLANDNKEVKKVGEFDISEFKGKLDTLNGEEEDIDEDEEYEKAHLDSESIDEIFAEIDDIDDVPIISVDSKEK